MSGFIAQVLELLQKLNEKINNEITRLLFCRKEGQRVKERNALDENGKQRHGRRGRR